MLDQSTIAALEGIASYGCVFLELVPASKFPTRSWDHFEELHYQRGHSRLDLVVRWLSKGSGVGYLPRNRMAAIDCDDMVTVNRVITYGLTHDIQFPHINTPSGGRHFIYELPASIDISTLKHHVCHPMENGVKVPWDHKLGPRTMLVAPGTLKLDANGAVIGSYRASPWIQPPVLDPRDLAPALKIFRDLTPFVCDLRPERDRIMGAMTYLRCCAPLCKGPGAWKTLWEVAVHLVAYYVLDPYLVLHMMTVDKGGYLSWNTRCTDTAGCPYPWLPGEILDVLRDATGDAPPYGIAMHKKKEARALARQCLDSFCQILDLVPQDCASRTISTEDLYTYFIIVMGVDREHCVIDEFGAEINKAIASRTLTTLTPHRTASRRGFRGADLDGIYLAHEFFKLKQTYLQDACNF